MAIRCCPIAINLKSKRAVAALEAGIKTGDLIQPYFVVGGAGKKEEIRSFPGQFRFSVDRLIKDVGKARSLGIDKALIFGIPGSKDNSGTGAYSKGNIVSLAVKALKSEFPKLTVMTDVCLCAYTSHGHCGIIKGQGWKIDKKATLEALSRIAVAHAEAGADYVAPSAMAKGQVSAIRKALDKEGFRFTKIMGYSAKFASSFYGPFREAANSAPEFGDRSGYQLDYRDAEKALAEIADDIKEGADIVMVKPALAYLDIIYRAKEKFKTPLAAYNVSGEYAMIKGQGSPNHSLRSGSGQAGVRGQGKEKKMILEILTAIKRAGADFIITYHAKDVARSVIRRT